MENKKKNNKENLLSFIPTGEYYYKKALTALQRDQYPKAQKYIQRATELSPNNSQILMQYGVILIEMQEFEKAMDILWRAHKLDPHKTDTLFFLAEVYAHLGLFWDARKYAKKYIEADIHGSYAAEALEIIDFAEQEDWQLFDDEGEAQDSEYFYQQERARRLMEKGEFPEAIEMLEKLIDEKPDFWGAYNNLALAYFYIGETEMAKALLHEVLRKNRGNLHALCNLAVFHYYEKNDELEDVLELLKKIQPYVYEHRYKLGATFALVGKYKEAYRWLKSLQKRGFDGDPAFYFWLSHAAYHSGYEEAAKQAWKQLTQMDPDKEGYEPWADTESMPHADALEHNRDYLIEKLDHPHKSERLFGLFLLGKSSHKQEIVSHPNWLKTDQISVLETYMLGYALGHQFKKSIPEERAFMRAMEATEVLYAEKGMVTHQHSYAFQMWFMMFDKAFERNYQFKNSKALAAAVDYMFSSSIDSTVTKKAVADRFGVSPATLTKYVNELIKYLPIFGP